MLLMHSEINDPFEKAALITIIKDLSMLDHYCGMPTTFSLNTHYIDYSKHIGN